MVGLAKAVAASHAKYLEDCIAFEAMQPGALTKAESWERHVDRCGQAVEEAGEAPISPDGLGWSYMSDVYRLKCMKIAEDAK